MFDPLEVAPEHEEETFSTLLSVSAHFLSRSFNKLFPSAFFISAYSERKIHRLFLKARELGAVISSKKAPSVVSPFERKKKINYSVLLLLLVMVK